MDMAEIVTHSPSRETFVFPDSMKVQIEQDLPGVALSTHPLVDSHIDLVAVTHINGDAQNIETVVVMPNRIRGISISSVGVDTQMTTQPAWGNNSCLSLVDTEVTDSTWIKLPKVYANPKYLRQEQRFAVTRDILEGNDQDSFAEKQAHWSTLIEHIDELVRSGNQGHKLQLLDEIGGLYQLRLILMSLIKGHKLSDLEANFSNGTKDAQDYAPTIDYPERPVDGSWDAPAWYQFSHNLVVASGNQALGIILHIDDEGNTELLCNWEFSPQSKRKLAILPGGGIHSQSQEDPLQALLRELQEELGVDINLSSSTLLNGVFMQTGTWYEPTHLVATLATNRGEVNNEGDEIAKVSAVTSDMKAPSWISMSAFEQEVLEGHIMDARIPASVYLALLEQSTDIWGVKLENPRQVIRAMAETKNLRDSGAMDAGSLGAAIEADLRAILKKDK